MVVKVPEDMEKKMNLIEPYELSTGYYDVREDAPEEVKLAAKEVKAFWHEVDAFAEENHLQ